MPRRRPRKRTARKGGLDREVAAWADRAEELRLDPRIDGVPCGRLPRSVLLEVHSASTDLANLVLVAVSHRQLHDRWLRLPQMRREVIHRHSLPPAEVSLTGAEALAVDSARNMWTQFLRSVLGAPPRGKLSRRQKKRLRARRQLRGATFCLGGISSGIPPELWELVRRYLGAAPLASVYASSELGVSAGLPEVPRPVRCQPPMGKCENDGVLRLRDAGTRETLEAMVEMDCCRICAVGSAYCPRHEWWGRGRCEGCEADEERYRDHDRDHDFDRGYYDSDHYERQDIGYISDR